MRFAVCCIAVALLLGASLAWADDESTSTVNGIDQVGRGYSLLFEKAARRQVMDVTKNGDGIASTQMFEFNKVIGKTTMSNFKEFQESQEREIKLTSTGGIKLPAVGGIETSYMLGTAAKTYLENSNEGEYLLSTASVRALKSVARLEYEHIKIKRSFARAVLDLYNTLKPDDEKTWEEVLRELPKDHKYKIIDFFETWGDSVIHKVFLGGRVRRTYKMSRSDLMLLSKKHIGVNAATEAGLNAKVNMEGVPLELSATDKRKLDLVYENMNKAGVKLEEVAESVHQSGGQPHNFLKDGQLVFFEWAKALKPSEYAVIGMEIWPIFQVIKKEMWPPEFVMSEEVLEEPEFGDDLDSGDSESEEALDEPVSEEPVPGDSESEEALDEPVFEEPVPGDSESEEALDEPVSEEPVPGDSESEEALDEPAFEEPVPGDSESEEALDEPVSGEPVPDAPPGAISVLELAPRSTPLPRVPPYDEDVQKFMKEAWLWRMGLEYLENEEINAWIEKVKSANFRKSCVCDVAIIVEKVGYEGDNIGNDINFDIKFCSGSRGSWQCHNSYIYRANNPVDGVFEHNEEKVLNKKTLIYNAGTCGEPIPLSVKISVSEDDLIPDKSPVYEKSLELHGCYESSHTRVFEVKVSEGLVFTDTAIFKFYVRVEPIMAKGGNGNVDKLERPTILIPAGRKPWEKRDWFDRMNSDH